MSEDRIHPQDRVPRLRQIPCAQRRRREQQHGGRYPPFSADNCQRGGPKTEESQTADDEGPGQHGVRVSRRATNAGEAHQKGSPMIAGWLISQ
jgi:hypothetical protein